MKFEFNDDSQKICNSADVVNYGIQCDICGNKFQSVSNINGRRYCVGCYYKTFIKDNQQTEIDQFKQQLAEKDKEINSLIVDYEKRISQEQELMSNLEKQLAEKEEELLKQKEKSARTEQIYNGIIVEKDKEIEKLNKTLEMCKHIERYDIGEMFLENAKLIIEKRQFAIQKLEKVKINLKDRITMMCNKEHSYLQKVVSWYDICNQVNKQIKDIKGE